MKRIFLFLILVLSTSCGQVKDLKSVETKPMEQAPLFFQSPLAVDGANIYYSLDDVLFYYNSETNKLTRLTSTFYADDKVANGDDVDYKHYYERLFRGFDLIFYDEHLYGIFERGQSDGSFSYSVKRLDSKGENLTELIKLDVLPSRIRIDSGKIYILTDGQNPEILVYDHKYTLIDKIDVKLGANGYGFYFEDGNLIVPDDELIVYQNGQISASYQIVNGPTGPGSSVENTEVIGIFKNGEVLSKFEGKVVIYVSEDYFYTTSLKGTQVYEQYDHEGVLINRIIPSETIETQGDIGTMFWKSDFSMIERVVKDRFVYGRTISSYFVCDLTTGVCRYLDE